MFFTRYSKAFQELSINGQKVEPEGTADSDTNYEDNEADQAESQENNTDTATDAENTPTPENNPEQQPSEQDEPTPDYSEEGNQDNQTTDTGGEETPNYDIPDDAEPAGDNAQEQDEPTPDYSEEGNQDNQTTDTGGEETPNYEDSGEETTGADGGGDATPDYELGDDETPNYDSNDGEISSDGEDAQTSDGSIEDDNGEAGASGSNLINDLKSMEDEIFADLTPEQKDIRDNELKQRYIDLYRVIDDSERRINNIIKKESTVKILEFITRKMNELKTLIHHNLTNVYDTRTYTENQAALQECIAIMHSICKMLDIISKDEECEDEQIG